MIAHNCESKSEAEAFKPLPGINWKISGELLTGFTGHAVGILGDK
jgi:hypothetical protein